MAARLQKIIHSLPVLYGLAANQALACGVKQGTVAIETPALSPVQTRTTIIGKDEAGNPKTMCAFVIHPDDPEKIVTGTIKGSNARFKFPDGSFVTLSTDGSTHSFSPAQNREELIHRQDEAATRTVKRLIIMCEGPTI